MKKVLILLCCTLLAISSCRKDRIKTTDITFESISISQDSCYTTLPNAFTPNGDNLNEFIRPMHRGVKADGFEFAIRNSNKKKIFSTTSLEEAWDGDDCPTGIYIGTIKGTFECGRSFEQSCFVCLYTDCVSHPNPDQLVFESMMDPITGSSVFVSGENICE